MNENNVDTVNSIESSQLWSSCSEALLEDDNNFEQWKAGMQKISRISDGISEEFRPRLWLTLAENSFRRKHITLDMSVLDRKLAGAENKLQTQISFDLHRTGSTFINPDNRQTLKRLLLRFACWNHRIGYCQGLNILAAIVLQVMNGSERDAFKVFVYLIEDVLPKDYFGSQLSGLSHDMAVFRHMFNIKLPQLALHLDRLQYESEYDQQLGAHLEPPLVNVFTMQWFITLFSNCFSQKTTLRIWDLILLDGNETLLRTALALWDYFSDRIISMRSADEFYTEMASLSSEVLSFDTNQTEVLINIICKMEPYPFPFLKQIREHYSHHSKNDSSLSKFKKTLSHLLTKMSFVGKHNNHINNHQDNNSNNRNNDFEEQLVLATFCLGDSTQRIPQSSTNARNKIRDKNHDKLLPNSYQQNDSSVSALNQIIQHLNLNTFSSNNNAPSSNNSNNMSNQSLCVLKRQYVKFKQRQKQAQTILYNLNNKNSIHDPSKIQSIHNKNNGNNNNKNIKFYRRSNTITSFLSETINEATKIVKRDLSKFSNPRLHDSELQNQHQLQRPQTVASSRYKSNLIKNQEAGQNSQKHPIADAQLVSIAKLRCIRFTISSESSTSTELCDDCSMFSDVSQSEDAFPDYHRSAVPENGDNHREDADNVDDDDHKTDNDNHFEDDKDYSGDVPLYKQYPNRQLSYSLDDLYSLDNTSVNSKEAFIKVHELTSQTKQMSLDND